MRVITPILTLFYDTWASSVHLVPTLWVWMSSCLMVNLQSWTSKSKSRLRRQAPVARWLARSRWKTRSSLSWSQWNGESFISAACMHKFYFKTLTDFFKHAFIYIIHFLVSYPWRKVPTRSWAKMGYTWSSRRTSLCTGELNIFQVFISARNFYSYFTVLILFIHFILFTACFLSVELFEAKKPARTSSLTSRWNIWTVGSLIRHECQKSSLAALRRPNCESQRRSLWPTSWQTTSTFRFICFRVLEF